MGKQDKDKINTSLVPKSELDISPFEEEEMRVEVLESIDKTGLVELRKQDIAKRSQILTLDTKENNLTSVEIINENITKLTELISDPTVLQKVLNNVETGKDYNEAVKAVSGLVDLRNKQLDKSIDPFASTGKKKKIAVQFQTQGVSVAMGVEVDE